MNKVERIKDLLRRRWADLFHCEFEIALGSRVTEGGARSARLDAWALACSWNNPRYVGVEIKVSRPDFVNDNKWPQYLDACTEFYFATAQGICSASEIPEQCGWMELSTNGARLLTRKKAPRLTSLNESVVRNMLKGALMRKVEGRRQNERLWWAKWAEQRKIDRELGAHVSRALAKTIQTRILEAERHNEMLERKLDALQSLHSWLQERNIPLQSTAFTERTGQMVIDAMIRDADLGLANFLTATKQLEDLAAQANRLRTKLVNP